VHACHDKAESKGEGYAVIDLQPGRLRYNIASTSFFTSVGVQAIATFNVQRSNV
jgi:hypothetical protein